MKEIVNICAVTGENIPHGMQTHSPDKAFFFFNQKVSIFFLYLQIIFLFSRVAFNEYPQHVFS